MQRVFFFSLQLAKYRNEWEIQGSKSITSLGVNGNLQVTKLNQLDVSDIMKPDAEQTVFGKNVAFLQLLLLRVGLMHN